MRNFILILLFLFVFYFLWELKKQKENLKKETQKNNQYKDSVSLMFSSINVEIEEAKKYKVENNIDYVQPYIKFSNEVFDI